MPSHATLRNAYRSRSWNCPVPSTVQMTYKCDGSNAMLVAARLPVDVDYCEASSTTSTNMLQALVKGHFAVGAAATDKNDQPLAGLEISGVVDIAKKGQAFADPFLRLQDNRACIAERYAVRCSSN